MSKQSFCHVENSLGSVYICEEVAAAVAARAASGRKACRSCPAV
ncbi:MAG: hypothetical protein ACPLSY_03550 [Moorellaceae bacterium]